MTIQEFIDILNSGKVVDGGAAVHQKIETNEKALVR